VLFIPAAHPPHRTAGTISDYEDRFRMVQLACQEDERFEASRLEEGAETSYSINTIERVAASTNSEPLYFLIGADAFAEIRTWYRWQDVLRAVTFIVVSRPGATYAIPDSARAVRLENMDLPISSSEIRKLVKTDAPKLPVPATVAAYIQEHQLYR
jgi:nicotinate-nucleotide adenylyltransferase